MKAWAVVLEWALGPGEPLGMGPEILRTLMEALSDLEPVALCQPDRYALQLRVEAGDPVAALDQAIARHHAAASQVPLGGELVRIELLTPEELRDEWARFADSEEGRSASDLLGGADDDDPVAEAEAALDIITDEAGAARVLARMVRRLGGGVVAARLQDEWTLPVDIAFGAGDPRVPIAEPWSFSRLRIERELPRLVEKAMRALRDLDAGIADDEAQPHVRTERSS